MLTRSRAPARPVSDVAVRRIWTLDGIIPFDGSPALLEPGALAYETLYAAAASVSARQSDSVDDALFQAACRAGLTPASIEVAEPLLFATPFDHRHRASTVRQSDGTSRVYVRGTPEAVLANCRFILSPGGPRELEAGEVPDLLRRASSGRYLAIARRDISDEEMSLPGEDPEDRLTLLGLLELESEAPPTTVVTRRPALSSNLRLPLLAFAIVTLQLAIYHVGRQGVGATLLIVMTAVFGAAFAVVEAVQLMKAQTA